MTAISKRKTVARAETSAMVRKRFLVVELRPYTVYIREKGRRIGYEVSWESVFILGAAKEADRKRAERNARKRGKA